MSVRAPNHSTTLLLVVGIALVGMSAPSSILSAGISEVSASPDIAVDLSGVPVRSREAAIDDLMGGIVIENFGGLVEGANVDAYHADGCCAVLFSTDTTVSLPGGMVAAPEDVMRLSVGGYALEFDGSVAGVPPGASVDAVTRLTSGELVLSFDVTVDLGSGIVVADEDLVQWDGANFTLLFDGSTAGIDAALDLDGADVIGGSAFALSYDGSGSVGSVSFHDEDLLVVDVSNPSFVLLFDASAAHSGWSGADLDAVSVPEPSVLTTLAAGTALLLVLAGRRNSVNQAS